MSPPRPQKSRNPDPRRAPYGARDVKSLNSNLPVTKNAEEFSSSVYVTVPILSNPFLSEGRRREAAFASGISADGLALSSDTESVTTGLFAPLRRRFGTSSTGDPEISTSPAGAITDIWFSIRKDSRRRTRLLFIAVADSRAV